MNPLAVSNVDVAMSVAFVILAATIAASQRTGEARPIISASTRALVQLVAIGFLIKALLQADSLLPTAALIAVMLAFATQIAGKRGHAVPGSYRVAAAAISAGSVSVLAVMIALSIIPPQAQYVIPIAGMLVGNCMSSCGIVLREVGRERHRSQAEIETALALGAHVSQATRDSRRRTMRAALGPLIDATKAVGTVSLPGAMTGMILAGISPLIAVKLQVIVFFMLLGCTSITVLAATRLGTRQLFTTRDALIGPQPPRCTQPIASPRIRQH